VVIACRVSIGVGSANIPANFEMSAVCVSDGVVAGVGVGLSLSAGAGVASVGVSLLLVRCSVGVVSAGLSLSCWCSCQCRFLNSCCRRSMFLATLKAMNE